MAREMKLPGPKSSKYIDYLKKADAGYNDPYPFVHSGKGKGCYFWDIDGNKFLDFASQVASNPLGYNHPELKAVVKRFSNSHPVKYAGSDFLVKEHVDLLKELLSITPKQLNSALFINSGAEAVENCLKIAMRKKKTATYGIAFENAFHGRTLGALSCTKTKPVQKANFLSIPIKRLPYDVSAFAELIISGVIP